MNIPVWISIYFAVIFLLDSVRILNCLHESKLPGFVCLPVLVAVYMGSIASTVETKNSFNG